MNTTIQLLSKIILDNAVCEFSNFITIVEGLEKIMPAKVSEVLKGSIAEELEIQAGDEIVSIDDTQMLDMIDYNFMCKADF